MIVSHKYKFIIVTPPKTASTTLHSWFIREPFCDWVWDDMNPKKGQHRHQIPEGCEEYLIGFAWRNPLDREVSLWKHAQNEIANMSFPEFVTKYQPCSPKPFYTRSQASFLPIRVDYYLPFDYIAQSVFQFPPVLKAIEDGHSLQVIPRLNTTTHKHYTEYYSGRLEQIVLNRFKEDLQFESMGTPQC